MMYRILLLFLSVILSATVCQAKVKNRGPKTYAYRYYLYDKFGCGYNIDHPSRFLSQKAIERRRRQHLKVDSTDLPVSRAYINRFQVKGARILATSRWNNTVVVEAADTSLLNLLAQLPCVKGSQHVWTSPDSIEDERPQMRIHEQFNRWDSIHNDPLGMARLQIEMLSGERLHELELRGEGIHIAVLDGGFQGVDLIPAFRNTKIVNTHDFVTHRQPEPFYSGIDHGTKVLSVLAANAPEVICGTAPEASYWLLKCEDPTAETPIEEDYWAMAAEYADSAGVDIINSSLGYYQYDAPFGSYRLQDLDGHTALISRSASLLARKGIILCCSAGNLGMASWKKISVPADATDILTIGAVNRDKKNAPFASVGPTQDGRIKPDVVALGSGTALLTGRGTLISDMGTSFSAPLVCGMVACLWQGLPRKNAKEIMELVRQSASQYDEPDNITGYGIPDFWMAFIMNFQ